MDETINKFWIFVHEANKTWEDIPDTRKFEPYLLRILQYVKGNKDYESQFKECFIQILNDDSIHAWEIVMYCMRDLRWEEVKEEVKKKWKSGDIRTKAVMEDILEAYEPNWSASELYGYYSGDKVRPLE
jgi:hypothetical protein